MAHIYMEGIYVGHFTKFERCQIAIYADLCLTGIKQQDFKKGSWGLDKRGM